MRHRLDNDVLLPRFLSRAMLQSDGCTLWGGVVIASGYGQFWNGEKMMLAHRFAYEVFNGPIPTGMMVCHRCDVRACVSPEHLFLGTQADNMHDCSVKGRTPTGTKHPRALNADVVAAIRAAVAQGATQQDTARRYGVASSTVSRLVHGQRHLVSWEQDEGDMDVAG